MQSAASVQPGEHNGVLLQTFLWNTPADGGNDVGYGIYAPYDLGEFDQKGSVATKHGIRAEYQAAVAACRAAGLQIYAEATSDPFPA